MILNASSHVQDPGFVVIPIRRVYPYPQANVIDAAILENLHGITADALLVAIGATQVF